MSVLSEVENHVDDLIRAINKKTLAAINAGSCRTRSDWDLAHAAEDAYEEREARVTSALVKLLKSDEETIRDLTYPVIDAAERATSAAADASACRTRSDWDRSHTAEDILAESREETINALVKLRQR